MFLDKFFNPNPKESDKKQSYYRPYGETNIGMRRKNNEDAILIFDRDDLSNQNQIHSVFAVADGVGGQVDGEVAANSLISSIYKYASRGRYLDQNALKEINSQIESGASTLVLAQQSNEDKNHYHIYSVGDSSAMILDQKNCNLTEITKRDENSTGTVTQAMGPDTGSAHLRQANQCSVFLEEGQTLLLASDGFTRYIDKYSFLPSDILKLRQRYPNQDNFVKALINQTNSLGGVDNVTIISIPHQS